MGSAGFPLGLSSSEHPRPQMAELGLGEDAEQIPSLLTFTEYLMAGKYSVRERRFGWVPLPQFLRPVSAPEERRRINSRSPLTPEVPGAHLEGPL